MHYVERFITPGEPPNDPASQVRAKRARLASEYGLPCEAGSAGWQPVPGPTWDDDEPKVLWARVALLVADVSCHTHTHMLGWYCWGIG